MADWIAIYAIGLISNSRSDPSKGNKNIFAFWVSFLLLHLGGPDSITSFSLEDNQLWIRLLFRLIAKLLAAAYILFQTFPDNNIWFPTILVLLVGTIKYAERLTAMYLANLKRFGSTTLPKPNPGYDYEESVAKYSQTRSVKVVEQTQITMVENLEHSYKDRSLDHSKKPEDMDMEILVTAYFLFQDFKGLLVGFILDPSDQKSSRNFFLNINSADVSFRLMEYELSLMYQLLHTKVSVVFNGIGLLVRFLSVCGMVVAFISYHYLVDKDKLENFELILGYVLASGAIFVDIISGIKLCFSDWLLMYIYRMSPEPRESWSANLSKKMNSIRDRILRGRRWSRSVSQYNMITLCLKLNRLENWPFSDFVISKIDKDHIFWYFTSEEKNIKELQCLIFKELKKKSLDPSDAVKACSHRGDWALSRSKSYVKLQWSISEFHYAESLILWHLATELCYQDNEHLATELCNQDNDHNDSSKRICKNISDYMFYLLAKKQELLAPVLGNVWQIVLQDTLEEAKGFFRKHLVKDQKKACKKLSNVKPKYRPAEVKGKSSKSVLFDACRLANQLQILEENHWDLMSRVWVELLCYSASNCQAIVHAKQLRQGGELLTFTWLLMNHLGLGS
ncbi:uncharacterized protein LOC107419137 [Ziziphus jujuba]|uniref:Uncharacterized protein LOC107419137 n=1 Tax=Ziziphus jujuba TaxID=326968 RepID=A0A6P3ZUD7_ZIZJJ|nr:uncharacterized protein LOC107419137 [Ziziphus jujuba]